MFKLFLGLFGYFFYKKKLPAVGRGNQHRLSRAGALCKEERQACMHSGAESRLYMLLHAAAGLNKTRDPLEEATVGARGTKSATCY